MLNSLSNKGENYAGNQSTRRSFPSNWQQGSDAGYSVLTPHGVIHVPGNNPLARQAFDALVKSYVTLQDIAQKAQAGEQAAR